MNRSYATALIKSPARCTFRLHYNLLFPMMEHNHISITIQNRPSILPINDHHNGDNNEPVNHTRPITHTATVSADVTAIFDASE